MSVTVRKYSPEDYSEICEIDKNLFEGMGGYVLFRHIEELFPSLFFVAIDLESKKIVGYILGGIHSDENSIGKLIRIGVAEKYRRIGCGEKLTQALLSEMKSRGVKNVHLTAAENNSAAISFYKKLGFAEKTRNAKYFYLDIPRLIIEKEI